MPTFRYKVREQSGAAREGTMEGEAAQAVALRLRENGLFVITVEAIKEQSKAGNSLSLDALFQRKMKAAELVLFCRQFATLLNAGVPLYNALVILQEQGRNEAFRQAMNSVIDDVRKGNTFSASVSKHTKVFPDIFVSMVEAGELGGILDEIMLRLATHFEKENDLQSKAKSAIIYPVIISIVAVGVVAFLIGYVIPTFSEVLTDMDVQLPLITRIVLAIAYAVQDYWYLGFVAVLVAALTYQQAMKQASMRYLRDLYILKIPFFGELLLKVAVARFTRTLGTLLKSGVPLMQSLEVVKKTVGNLVVSEGIGNAQESITRGMGIYEPLNTNPVFPRMVVQMVGVGEETGMLDQMLEKIADYYDTEVGTIVGRMSSVIEPILMVIMGIIVGVIVIAMFLPMFEMIGPSGPAAQ
ncbi:type II secretion system F family protein [Heliophilum fasciatum]|uniref:Type IV pilus assembly protein PilC n=1 Tax=Heliophilum fasciatum TaxID=35700 RepID=A0A4R2RVX9_9FIRM|nr:type II secretion system F family protein [Heliophilum fasciatum]MCW2277282.1 type IV pilus assembly protein PilC [Heliophilum fasciatum]TCP67119.1 type IV pilus assembly protein PilC [Heliophilum fasciatum]